MSDTTPHHSDHAPGLMTPIPAEDSPLPHWATFPATTFITAPSCSRPTSVFVSTSSNVVPPIASAVPLLPAFEPPPRGTCKIAIAVQQQQEGQVAIPVVYAVQHSGLHMAFPVTCQLLGTVWRTPAEMGARVFSEVPEGDHASFLARRLALPVEVVLSLAGCLEEQAARSCTPEALEE